MSLLPPRPGEPDAAPRGGALLPLLFIGLVAMGVGSVLLVFAPHFLLVYGVLFVLVVAQYFIWGRWLRNAIIAEDEAEAELGQPPPPEQGNGMPR